MYNSLFQGTNCWKTFTYETYKIQLQRIHFSEHLSQVKCFILHSSYVLQYIRDWSVKIYQRETQI